MTEFTIPAPMWRRFAAAVYDALIFVAIWAIVVQAVTLLRLALGAALHPSLLQAAVFVAGLLFFGWFWTHTGQTTGMRAWRLQVRRLDAAGLRWPVAAARYAAMMVWAGTLLAPPALLLLPARIAPADRGAWAILTAVFAVAGLVVQKLDSRHRAPHDWLAGTEVVQLPAAPA
jgi:uncharacterized RDD family membrane protein YckC